MTQNIHINWLPYLDEATRTINVRQQDWLRVNSKMKCPICNHADGCMIHSDEPKYICIRVPGDYQITSGKGLGGWIHIDNPIPDYFDHSKYVEKTLEEKLKIHGKESARRAPDEELHEFYAFVHQNFKLNKKHREYLESQGIKDVSEYGSLPNGGEYRCIEVPNYFGEGIPGLFSSVKGNKKYLNLRAYGLYRVIRSPENLIVGIEIRLDDSCKEMLDTTSKYQPLTSARKTLGVQADIKRYGYIGGSDKTKLIITEGAKKAHIAHQKYDCDVIYIRGVGNWHRVTSEIQDYFPKLKDIYIAFDSDKYTNKMVQQQFDMLTEELISKFEYSVYSLEWDQKFKGIDDAINAGSQIKKKKIHQGSDLYTLDEISGELKKTVEHIFVSQDGKTHVLKVTPGAGKTQSVINMINERLMSGDWFVNKEGKPARILWLTENNYNLLSEAENQFVIPPARLEGRNPDPSSEFYCGEFELVQAAGEKNHSIVHSVCMECPMLKECSYMNRSKQIMDKELFVIGVKASFFNESDRLDKFDVIVIDESMTDAMYKQKEITQFDLATHKRQLEYLIKKENDSTKRTRMELSEMVLDMLNEKIIDWNQLRDQKDTEIDPLNITNDLSDLKDCFTEYEKEPFENSDGEKVFLKVFMEDLFKSCVHVNDGKIIINAPQRKLFEHFKNKTIVNLDATPSMFKLRTLEQNGMNELEIHNFRVKEYVNVVQIGGLSGSKTHLLSEKYQPRFLETIKFIATKHDNSKTTVLAPKKFIEALEDYQKEHDFYTMTGWYGNHTKGFNNFEGTDNIILPGYYIKNLAHMKMELETLLFMGCKDVSMDKLIIEDTENELIQAVGRGRACRRQSNPVNVFFITSKKVPAIYKTIQIPSMEVFMGKRVKDQQSHNKKVKAENDFKARQALDKESDGVLIPNLDLKALAAKYDVAERALERIGKEIYREQLIQACENPELFQDEWLDYYVSNLILPTPQDCRRLKLQLTLISPSVLYNISTRELTMLIRGDKRVSAYFKQHPPVGILQNKWDAVIDFIAQSGHDTLTYIDIGAGAGVTRQIAGKYVRAMVSMIEEIGGVESFVEMLEPKPDKPIKQADSDVYEGAEQMKITLTTIADMVTMPEILEESKGFNAIEQVMVKNEIYDTNEFSSFLVKIMMDFVSASDPDVKKRKYSDMKRVYDQFFGESHGEER